MTTASALILCARTSREQMRRSARRYVAFRTVGWQTEAERALQQAVRLRDTANSYQQAAGRGRA